MLMDSGWVRRMTTRIVGTGSYVPEQIVTNDDLAKIVETNDEWIRSRTGIGARRIATNEGTSYMAAEASVNALENAGVKPDEIDLILLATSSPASRFRTPTSISSLPTTCPATTSNRSIAILPQSPWMRPPLSYGRSSGLMKTESWCANRRFKRGFSGRTTSGSPCP